MLCEVTHLDLNPVHACINTKGFMVELILTVKVIYAKRTFNIVFRKYGAGPKRVVPMAGKDLPETVTTNKRKRVTQRSGDRHTLRLTLTSNFTSHQSAVRVVCHLLLLPSAFREKRNYREFRPTLPRSRR